MLLKNDKFYYLTLNELEWNDSQPNVFGDSFINSLADATVLSSGNGQTMTLIDIINHGNPNFLTFIIAYLDWYLNIPVRADSIEEAIDKEINNGTPLLATATLKWWEKEIVPNFSKIIEAFFKDYNPIENYNRVESSTLTKAGTETHTTTGTTSSSSTGTNGNAHTIGEGSTTTTDVRHAADSGTAVPTTGETMSQAEQLITDTGTNSSMAEGSTSGSDKLSFSGRTDTTQSTVSGNIGVTTTQQMIESTIELYETDLYDYLHRRWFDTFFFLV